MDAQLDWQVPQGIHYDLRVVRSCRPGYNNSTDSSGDGWWSEPSDFPGMDMQRGFGYVIDDDYGGAPTGFQVYASGRFAGSGSLNLTEVPRTTIDCWARTTTLYQDGHRDWTPNYGKPYKQRDCP